MEHREVKFPANLINIRVQANSSYQIGRILDIVESEKGLTLMSKSEIKTNQTFLENCKNNELKKRNRKKTKKFSMIAYQATKKRRTKLSNAEIVKYKNMFTSF